MVQASRARSGWSSVWATSSIHTTQNRWCVQEPHANSEIFNKLCINIPGYTVLRNILTKFSNHSDIIIKLITPHAPHYLSIHPNQYAFLLKSLFIRVKVELQKNNGQQDSVSAFCSVQIIFHISLHVQLALLSSFSKSRLWQICSFNPGNSGFWWNLYNRCLQPRMRHMSNVIILHLCKILCYANDKPRNNAIIVLFIYNKQYLCYTSIKIFPKALKAPNTDWSLSFHKVYWKKVFHTALFF